MTQPQHELSGSLERKPVRRIVYGALGSLAITTVQVAASFSNISGGGHNVLRTLGIENIDGMLYLGSARAAQVAQKENVPKEQRERVVKRWRAGTLGLICAGALYTGYEAVDDLFEGDFHPATPVSIGLVAAGVTVNRVVERGLHGHAGEQGAHRDAWRHAMTDMAVGIGMGVALTANYATYRYGIDTGWTRALPDAAAALGSGIIFAANAPVPARLRDSGVYDYDTLDEDA